MSNSNKHEPAEFYLYRYQISVDKSPIQLQFGEDITREKLYEERNRYLLKALETIANSPSTDSSYTYKIEAQPNDTQILLFVQAERTKTITQDKKDYHVPHQPYGWVAIDLDPHIQTIGITSRGDLKAKHVFSDLDKKLQSILSAKHLNIFIEAIRKHRAFWQIVNDNRDKIKEVGIIINPPNMPELTSTFDKELSQFTESAGAKQTALILKAKKDATLNIEESNPRLNALANYADQGGAKYYFKTTESLTKITPEGKQDILRGVPVENTDRLNIQTDGDEHYKSILTRIREWCRLPRR